MMLVLLLSCLISVANTLHPQYKPRIDPKAVRFDREDNCVYPGYKAGGGRVVIDPITSPSATLHTNELNSLLAFGTRAGSIGDKVVAKIAQYSAVAAAKAGKKLATSIGLFGAVFGGLLDLAKPSTGDILDSVNKAIEKLTDEVNERLADMRELINEKVTNLEKTLMIDEYLTNANYWKSCMEVANVEDGNRCQEEAYRLSWSKRSKFAPFYTTWDDGEGSIYESEENFRRAEVNLITFRNYAELNIVMLLTLIESYKGCSPNLDEEIYQGDNERYQRDKERYQHYQEELTTCVDFSYKYLKWSTEQVQKAYDEFSLDTHGHLSCKNTQEVWEGWPKVHTADYYHCTARLGYGYSVSSKCDIMFTQRFDGKRVHGYGHENEGGVTRVGPGYVDRRYRTSISKERKAVKNYMASEFRDILNKWKDVSDKRGKTAEPGVSRRSIDINVDQERLNAAQIEAAQISRHWKKVSLESSGSGYKQYENDDDDDDDDEGLAEKDYIKADEK